MSLKTKSAARRFLVRLADRPEDFVAAQRLRYRVFVTELGADGATVDHENQLEKDAFDPLYDHLLLVDPKRDPKNLDHVIGVYRLLRGEVAGENTGFYSAGEYDLTPLLGSGRRLLELGRSCIDKDFRGGIALYHLWNGLAEYVLRHKIEIMFGVASYHGTDSAKIAHSLSFLHQNHLAPKDLRVRVRGGSLVRLDLLPAAKIEVPLAMEQTPPLIKAYLRLGGYIGEGAFIDKDFNTIDVFLMMDTAAMSEKHRSAYTRRVDAGR